MRIFWVGWGLMQHHDWDSGGGCCYFVQLGVWGSGKGLLPGGWEVEKGALGFSMWLSEALGYLDQGRAEWCVFNHYWETQMFLPVGKDQECRFPWPLPLLPGLGTRLEFGITQQYPVLATVEETEREAAPCGCLSRQEQRGRRRSVGTSGQGQDRMGLLLGRREPVPVFASAPPSPEAPGACGELGESGCLDSRWVSCSCPQTPLDFPPWKSSSCFLGNLWEALCRCWKWHSLSGGRCWQGGTLLPHVGWGILGEAAGWIRSQGGSLASFQGT